MENNHAKIDKWLKEIGFYMGASLNQKKRNSGEGLGCGIFFVVFSKNDCRFRILVYLQAITIRHRERQRGKAFQTEIIDYQ